MIDTKQSLDDRLAFLVRPEGSSPGARLWIAGVPISRYSTLAACQQDANTIRAAISDLCDDVIASVLRKGLSGCPVSETQLQTLLDTDEIRDVMRRIGDHDIPRDRVEAFMEQTAARVDMLGRTIVYLLARLATTSVAQQAANRN